MEGISKEQDSNGNNNIDQKKLERQLERGNMFSHTALGESFMRLGEAEAFLYGLIDILLSRQIVTEEEIMESTSKIRKELIDRGQFIGPGTAVRIEDTGEMTPDNTIDCSERQHICKSVCCRLDFALSVKEVESGKIKWDMGRPYFIRHENTGYCTHNSNSLQCDIYADRPAVCRKYYCAGDSRIWKDFEKKELNFEWIENNLSVLKNPLLIACTMHHPMNIKSINSNFDNIRK
jgi:Fe-S-cluster containining protein